MTLINITFRRCISTTNVCNGKKNFRKFMLHNKRGTRIFKQQQSENPDPEIPIDHRGVRQIGYKLNGKFVRVPEMVPEIIVPDLTGFKLKPYVSYRAPEVIQTEFTAQDLFNVVYSKKIINDFEVGKLDEKGNPINPSEEEKLTPEKAKLKAKQTGTDIFCK